MTDFMQIATWILMDVIVKSIKDQIMKFIGWLFNTEKSQSLSPKKRIVRRKTQPIIRQRKNMIANSSPSIPTKPLNRINTTAGTRARLNIIRSEIKTTETPGSINNKDLNLKLSPAPFLPGSLPLTPPQFQQSRPQTRSQSRLHERINAFEHNNRYAISSSSSSSNSNINSDSEEDVEKEKNRNNVKLKANQPLSEYDYTKLQINPFIKQLRFKTSSYVREKEKCINIIIKK